MKRKWRNPVRLGDRGLFSLAAHVAGDFSQQNFSNGYSLFFREGCECSAKERGWREPWGVRMIGGFQAATFTAASQIERSGEKNLPAIWGDSGFSLSGRSGSMAGTLFLLGKFHGRGLLDCSP